MITVDGTEYDVRVVFESLKRSFSIVEGGNAGTAINARTIRDILGTAYSYTMNVEPNGLNKDDYDAFYEVISAPVDYHSITVPYGQETLTFDAMIVSGSDTWRGAMQGNRWSGLSVEFIPVEPQRRS